MWPFGRGRAEARGSRSLGAIGEKLAVRCLRGKGYKILARNFRCPAGEVDIIALDRSGCEGGAETIVFVEVKARSSEKYVGPESAVDSRKRRQLSRVARYYLARHDAGGFAVRFDVVAVVAAADLQPQVRHIPDAFTPA